MVAYMVSNPSPSEISRSDLHTSTMRYLFSVDLTLINSSVRSGEFNAMQRNIVMQLINYISSFLFAFTCPTPQSQNLKSERYRLKLVVTELDAATAIEYQIALLAFVNCVIISAPTLPKRIKIRNEFIGEQ